VGDDGPVPVEGQRWIGFVPRQHEVDGAPRRGEGRVVEVSLGEHRRETRRYQHGIAFAQRDVEALGEPQHHLPARRCPAGLHEAEVARRDLGFQREVHLAQAAALAPVAQQVADGAAGRAGGGGSCRHRERLAPPAAPDQ